MQFFKVILPFTKKSSYSYLNNVFLKDLLQLISLLILSIFFIHYTPKIVARVFFLVLLFIFYRSRKDYLWFAFIFIIIEEPGGFFSGGKIDDPYRIPAYAIIPGSSFLYCELFTFVAIIKAINKGKRIKLFIHKPLNILLIYLLISYFFSIIIGMSLNTHIKTMRFLIGLSFLYSIPCLIYRKEDFIFMSYLLFFIMVLTFLGHIYHLITGYEVRIILTGTSLFEKTVIFESEYGARIAYSVFLNLFCIISSLFFISQKKINNNKIYLYFISSICFLSIFLTATRGWIVAYFIMLGIFSWKFIKTSKNWIKMIIILPFIFILLYTYIPSIHVQIKKSWNRFTTLELLLKGDITAGGTLQRLNVRGPISINKFKEKPILGWDFQMNITNIRIHMSETKIY